MLVDRPPKLLIPLLVALPNPLPVVDVLEAIRWSSYPLLMASLELKLDVSGVNGLAHDKVF